MEEKYVCPACSGEKQDCAVCNGEGTVDSYGFLKALSELDKPTKVQRLIDQLFPLYVGDIKNYEKELVIESVQNLMSETDFVSERDIQVIKACLSEISEKGYFLLF